MEEILIIIVDEIQNFVYSNGEWTVEKRVSWIFYCFIFRWHGCRSGWAIDCCAAWRRFDPPTEQIFVWSAGRCSRSSFLCVIFYVRLVKKWFHLYFNHNFFESLRVIAVFENTSKMSFGKTRSPSKRCLNWFPKYWERQSCRENSHRYVEYLFTLYLLTFPY